MKATTPEPFSLSASHAPPLTTVVRRFSRGRRASSALHTELAIDTRVKRAENKMLPRIVLLGAPKVGKTTLYKLFKLEDRGFFTKDEIDDATRLKSRLSSSTTQKSSSSKSDLTMGDLSDEDDAPGEVDAVFAFDDEDHCIAVDASLVVRNSGPTKAVESYDLGWAPLRVVDFPSRKATWLPHFKDVAVVVFVVDLRACMRSRAILQKAKTVFVDVLTSPYFSDDSIKFCIVLNDVESKKADEASEAPNFGDTMSPESIEYVFTDAYASYSEHMMLELFIKRIDLFDVAAGKRLVRECVDLVKDDLAISPDVRPRSLSSEVGEQGAYDDACDEELH